MIKAFMELRRWALEIGLRDAPAVTLRLPSLEAATVACANVGVLWGRGDPGYPGDVRYLYGIPLTIVWNKDPEPPEPSTFWMV